MNASKRLEVKLGIVCCGVAVGAWTGCAIGQEPTHDSETSEWSHAEIRTESDFYEPLSPYGRWEVVGSFGRCWIPAGVDAEWSPYSNGYWQQSDAGWYWESDEPWGWATYHYGRWDMSPQYGWYWVPQTEWAPAWVSWREGGGYVGWAPLSPSGRGVEVSRKGAAQGGYVFVEERRFLEPVRPTVFNANGSFIEKTVINRGPGAAVIEKASGRRATATPARDLRSKAEAKVIAKHPTPTPAREKTVQSLPHPTEITPPPRASSQIEKPTVSTPTPLPPAARNEVHPADARSRIASPQGEPHMAQETPKTMGSERDKQVAPAVEARREAPQEAQREIKSQAPPAAKPEVNSEVKHAAKPVLKADMPQPAKPEPQPVAMTGPKPAPEQPPAAREVTEQKPAKDADKKDQ
jgi:hypothetical protein